MSLERRRQEESRFKTKAKKIAKSWGIQETDEKNIGRIYSTHGKSCSCYACGNQRKYNNEKTLKEITSEKNFKKDLENF
jgi:hypothetical protein